MSVDATACDTATGHSVGSSGDLWVTLQRLGEGLSLKSLSRAARIPFASAVEKDAEAAVFWAPRTGADRYPDWAAFEHSCRFPGNAPSRVWRIAEDPTRVCYLGQQMVGGAVAYPMAAALWRGWLPTAIRAPRGLLWQGVQRAHLWLVAPSRFPRHVAFAGVASAEAVLVALACHADSSSFTLELGGVPGEVASELSARFRGPIVPVEPFAQLRVPAPLRERLLDLEDHTTYLPAVGAALALLEGPPRSLVTCESLAAVAADGG